MNFSFPSNILKKRLSVLIQYAFSLILLCCCSIQAGKTVESSSKLFLNNHTYQSISEFDQHVRSAVSDKKNRSPQARGRKEQLSQSDLFYLTKAWKYLSDATRNEYMALSIIPDSASVFTTPGNHFEIYFIPSHKASHLNSDNYSFDRNSWRIKSFTPNGIPDYIDEIGWALDSCWELEVNKFNFIAPIPYRTDIFQSEKYKVIAYDAQEYGYTYPFPASDKTLYPKGWSSIIDIATNWTALRYDTNPLDAIRVTCAHEFFHAIQFSMTWNVIENVNLMLDDYPLAWLEGTATSLEEIAFPSVDDYIRYSPYYFSTPERPFLHDNNISNGFFYANSLLMLYISKTLSPFSIEFTRSVFFNNYEKPFPFYSNIRTVSKKYNKHWTDLLHDFHVASFYSGKYADSTRFLDDAQSFDTLVVKDDSIVSSQPIIKRVLPYSMKLFTKRNTNPNPIDSVRLFFNHISLPSDSGADVDWKASILRIRTSIDTSIAVSLNKNGDGTCTIYSIAPDERIIAVVTNGDALESKDYSVLFNDCTDNIYTSDTIRFTSFSTDSLSFASALFKLDTTTLPCTPSLSIASGKIYAEKAASMSLQLKSAPFAFTYPLIWQEKSNCSFSISVKNSTDVDCSVYKWNETQQIWENVSVFTKKIINNYNTFTIDNPVSGIYSIGKIVDNIKIAVYPNPVSLKKGAVFFSGKSIKTIAIYDASGKFIHFETPDMNIPYQWDLRTKFNKIIVPGIYYAVVEFVSNFNEREIYKQKIVVTP